MPVFKDELALNRPKPGYHSHKAQRVHLEHQASVSAPSLARALVSAHFKFATLGSGGHGKENTLQRASQPACLLAPMITLRRRSLRAGHKIIVLQLLHITTLLLSYYYKITSSLLFHYNNITTLSLLHFT